MWPWAAQAGGPRIGDPRSYDVTTYSRYCPNIWLDTPEQLDVPSLNLTLQSRYLPSTSQTNLI